MSIPGFAAEASIYRSTSPQRIQSTKETASLATECAWCFSAFYGLATKLSQYLAHST
jgi:hypothetical protein